MAAGALFALVLLASLGLGLALYGLVRAEAADRTVADRAEAERLARRDTDDREECTECGRV